MRRAQLLLLTAALVTGGFLAHAVASDLTASDPTAGNRDEVILPRWDDMCIGLDVLAQGRPLPTVQYQGRTYLPVPRWGTEYALRVRNDGPRRILAIVSVDGLSVISGKPASEAQTGYIVAARDSIVIKGWRRSLETVAATSSLQWPAGR